MEKNLKNLLLKDLCARLPYGVKVKYFNSEDNREDIDVVEGIELYGKDAEFSVFQYGLKIDGFKPYLRPMLSMTEEELNECVCQSGIKDIECPNWQDIPKEKQFEARLNHAIAVFLTDSNNVDWLNAHHFDYRGLIPMGLALPATKDMYNI